MKTLLYGLLAETSVHPGAGQSSGFVDLPVAREAATDYPVIVGSSMKGALLGMGRDRGTSSSELRVLFGSAEVVDGETGGAGSLLVSDARLLLLPIRSLTSHFMWVTCPYLIERYMRDRKRSDLTTEIFEFSPVNGDDSESPKYLGPEVGELFLEERQFSRGGSLPDKLTEALIPLIRHGETKKRLEKQLVVVSDQSFAWFARYGLSVNARNVLHKEKKTSENLWYEETLPPDSLFYLLLAERSGGSLDKIQAQFNGKPYLQVGGNETVGQGWFVVSESLKGGRQ
jgi:CRISPR-associated protein Cmr4